MCTLFCMALGAPSAVAQQATAPPQQTQLYPLTLEEAAQLLQNHNNAIKISQAATEVAAAQKRELNAAWYPMISSSGGYFLSKNGISAQVNVGETAGELIGELFPQLAPLASQIKGIAISIPLLDKEITTIDATAIWSLFTGGKRLYASRIGKEITNSAEHLLVITQNTQMALMINTFYTLKLCHEVEQMQQENLDYMSRLIFNATRLKEEGFINKAELLIVHVAQDDAIRELESARHNTQSAAAALNAILGTEVEATPIGEYFTLEEIPSTAALQEEILSNNSQLKLLGSQEEILHNNGKIAKSDYLPTLALYSRQSIYTNIPQNLLPRTTVGAAMQWDIFDGLIRESRIKQNRLQQEQMEFTIDQTREDLFTAAIALRGKMEDAHYSILTFTQTLNLAQELLREREKEFAEGLCTTTQTIEARTALTKARTALSLARWEYCTTLANLLAITSNTDKFIELHNEYRK